jgi:hypothetical protein
MATSSNGSSKTQAKRTKANAKRTAGSAGRTAKAAAPEKSQVQSIAETAVDLPVGTVLTVADRLSDLVSPWTDRRGAETQAKAYRTRVTRTLKRAERRGATARRKATTEAKRTRNRVEREARKRQRTVETTLKRNRNEAEQRVRKAIDEQTARAQDLVDQVTEQLSSLR